MDSPATTEFSKPWFCPVLLFLFLIPSLPCALSHPDTGLCQRFFECGNIKAGFPFWGGKRNILCGHPLLELHCNRTLHRTSLEISGLSYEVLHIDNKSSTIKLARDDYSDTFSFCSGRIPNTTLPPELFELLPGYKDLTISYQCDHTSRYLKDSECPWSGLGSEYRGSCNQTLNVTVPVSFLADKEPWSFTYLEHVLKEGFEVKLKIDEQVCQQCLSSGGNCAFRKNIQVCCKELLSPDFECHLMNSSAVDELHKLCSNPFSCGNQQSLSYPFWTGGREVCGHPDFEVHCNEQFADINFSSVRFRILKVDVYSSRTLRLARTDYLNNLCPSNPVSVTIVNEILLGYTPDTEVVTLYYDCPDFSSRIPADSYVGDLGCDDDGEGNGYFVTKNLSSPLLDGIRFLLGNFTQSCRSVNIPASAPALVKLGTKPTPQDLQTAFGEGFGLTLNYTVCQQCVESSGACGHDQSTKRFVCYCPDGPHELTCNSEKKSSSALSGGKKIAIGIASGLVGGLLIAGGVFCFISQRRKKLLAQYTSKDLPTTPYSSRGTTNTATSTTISRSPRSFFSSNSNLGNGSGYFGVKVFSYEELEEATENFSKELGDGGFGTVYYGVLRDGRAVAVKRLYERSLRHVEQFKNEIEILKSLKHPNLVILYGCTSRHSRELLLVYEYISNGTLADHLHGDHAKTRPLSWPVRLEIAIETASALSYLHASGIIHRDVKTTNILLDNNFQVKVADFGLSRLFPTNATHVSTAPQGTPGYVDPEYYQCYRLNEKSDVYSFGVVLAELISSKEAVDITRHRHDINLANMAVARIQNAAVEELIDPDLGFDKDFAVRRMMTAVAELAFRCLQQEREMRPSMDEVVEVLKVIKKEEMSEPAEMVDIGGDEVGLLRNGGAPPPLSPETDKRTNSSNSTSDTTASSF